MILCSRFHLLEVNDQEWWPSYLRAKVQECLTLAWTFRVPVVQSVSPAILVATTLLKVLAQRVDDFVFVDFASGAGGPTPWIEAEVNTRICSRSTDRPKEGVSFVMTDLRPHVQAWQAACKKSDSGKLGYVADGVDATAAPADLLSKVDGGGVSSASHKKGIFRLFSLAFHHFDDDLAQEILKNTIENSDGFGIFELQSRTISSLITVFLFGPLIAVLSPFFFYSQPLHLFFTYIIPLIPFCLVFDGYISSIRTRTPAEVEALLTKANGGKKLEGWKFVSGEEVHTWPTGWLNWIICVKE